MVMKDVPENISKKTMQKWRFSYNCENKKKSPLIGSSPTIVLKLLLNSSYESFESIRLVHCEVGQYLAIETDTFLTQLMNKGRVSKAFGADSGIDTRDPQRAVFSFL